MKFAADYAQALKLDLDGGQLLIGGTGRLKPFAQRGRGYAKFPADTPLLVQYRTPSGQQHNVGELPSHHLRTLADHLPEEHAHALHAYLDSHYEQPPQEGR